MNKAQARGILATTILGSGMAMLDGTVVNIALPAIGRQLGSSVAGLQWIIDGYLLALAALILIAGSLSDRYGRRKVFLVGVVWFGLASLLCGLAPTTSLLVAARILQGIGGALLTPGSLAILQSSFPRGERAKAIGAWSGISGLATVLGPLVGGLLVQAGSWRLVFLINLPIAALCCWLALRYVPESTSGDTGRPDIVGSILGALGLAGVTAALVEAPGLGLTHPVVLICSSIGVVALIVFVLAQIRGSRPLVPPILFANRTFLLSNGLTFLVYAALGGVMMLLVLQLQTSLGYAPTAAGLASLPMSLIMLATSALSGRLAQRYGPRWQLVSGPMVIAAGILLLNLAVPGADYVTGVLPGIVIFGIGLTLVVAPVTATVLAAAPDRLAGAASGVNNAIARTGSLLAVAILPVVSGLTGTEYAQPVALTNSWHVSLMICAALCVLGGLFALGIDNKVLAESETQTDQKEHPGMGECLSCGIDGPPTQIR